MANQVPLLVLFHAAKYLTMNDEEVTIKAVKEIVEEGNSFRKQNIRRQVCKLLMDMITSTCYN